MDLPETTVINLTRRPDRLATIRQRWAMLCTGRDLQVHPAVDGLTDLPPEAPAWARREPGIYGCFSSHRQLLSSSDGPHLVLEDDAVFGPNFLHTVAALDPPADWDLIFLGGQHIAQPLPYGAGLVVPSRIQRTHAYLVRDPPKIAQLLDGSAYHHIDWVLSRLPIVRYAVTPWLVGQDGSPSDVTGTVRVENFWNG